ncbi:hypothetical protein IFM89_008925 [Coptis chinensis]|uniref:Uncharacterized protein n=1 Tax=Coptis chinensis TaxID=261450 RepID=A0A835LHF7_9MAGN|nr:hypothetical protein IFM89_008925 [Coptis chinensis]
MTSSCDTLEWVHNVLSSGGHGNMKPPESLRKLILFSGNDYLGLNYHPTVRMAAAEADLVSSFSSLNDFVEENDKKARKDIIIKYVDVATLGNLCVDVVLSVPTLSPPSFEERRAYMDKLSSSKPDKKYWEAGGNCNMVIAAARIGLSCLSLGHVGDEIYGRFLLDVLHDEGIGMVEMSEDTDANAGNAAYETLLCWVLVDPLHRHDFYSRADFSKDPAFGWMSKLSGEVKSAIKRSKNLLCNGYTFGFVKSKLHHSWMKDCIMQADEYSCECETASCGGMDLNILFVPVRKKSVNSPALSALEEGRTMPTVPLPEKCEFSVVACPRYVSYRGTIMLMFFRTSKLKLSLSVITQPSRIKVRSEGIPNDTVEAVLPSGLPESFVEDCKLQEILHKSVEFLLSLWKQARFFDETIAAYRRALSNPWNLDSQKLATIQKDLDAASIEPTGSPLQAMANKQKKRNNCIKEELIGPC